MVRRLKFETIDIDNYIFLRCLTGIVLAIYVNNIIIFNFNKEEVMFIKKQIADEFDMKDLADSTLIFDF